MYDLSDTGSVKSYGSYGSVSSLAMAQSGAPELLVSLCYQSLTGRLTVEVLKASNLRNVSMQRAPGIVAICMCTNNLSYFLSDVLHKKYTLLTAAVKLSEVKKAITTRFLARCSASCFGRFAVQICLRNRNEKTSGTGVTEIGRTYKKANGQAKPE